ncbi:MAG TPA: hypothetical protein VHR47_05685 [Bacillota bacterium]|nr:hypothetical protein [Bacillota bacterium]
MTKDQFLEVIAPRLKDISSADKSILEKSFPNGMVKAHYCVRRWDNADGGTVQYYVLTDTYFVDLTIKSHSITVRQIKLQVEIIEKSYKIERMPQLSLEPMNIILRLKDTEPIHLLKPDQAELENYQEFLKSLLDL